LEQFYDGKNISESAGAGIVEALKPRKTSSMTTKRSFAVNLGDQGASGPVGDPWAVLYRLYKTTVSEKRKCTIVFYKGSLPIFCPWFIQDYTV
jgi:hypothetical protein